ncbi:MULTISPECIES: phosphate ABC transporter permease subunit PstC [Rhodomicrobium]|uniref:phosphate ABC transporter permease subunit PstC n=1 Tax=Rhodomicrobium TaxID=1068 RepID=UPI000B4BB52D|nr:MULTISPECIES: phosphate ABC transporter permease subunit PstC [Rhodomicrobium]
MFIYVLAAILALTLSGYVIGQRRSLKLAGGEARSLHSRPGYYGAYVAAWVGIPSLILVLIWLLFQGPVIDALLLASLPDEKTANLSSAQVSLLISEIKQVSRGNIFGQPDQAILDAGVRYQNWRLIASWSMLTAAISLCLAGLVINRARIAPAFRARQRVEGVMTGFMIACSIAAILTTVGIVLSLLIEALRFFSLVSPLDFLFGLRWEPQIAMRADQSLGSGAFGAIPVFLGTLEIALFAMLVAIPIGLFTAIYLTEYAHPKFRAVIKPVVEILAGIPTVVYGFFAILIVAPAFKNFMNSIGIDAAPNSAFVAGAVMGIMIIPFISSLSDDAITAVPRSLRDGSYALGATQAETIMQILLPAALPGIMGGVLLAVSRAIGETMIVVMAAGIIATLTLNPLEPVTTVTVQIVTLLIGDTEFDSPKTLAAFALGLVLFTVTLCLNVIALRIVQKYRERYD